MGTGMLTCWESNRLVCAGGVAYLHNKQKNNHSLAQG